MSFIMDMYMGLVVHGTHIHTRTRLVSPDKVLQYWVHQVLPPQQTSKHN